MPNLNRTIPIATPHPVRPIKILIVIPQPTRAVISTHDDTTLQPGPPTPW